MRIEERQEGCASGGRHIAGSNGGLCVCGQTEAVCVSSVSGPTICARLVQKPSGRQC